MSANIFYNRIVRKYVIGFGNLFNNITLVRYNPDESEQERMLVPISYASKERYVMRLQGDPELNKKVKMTLPRMSFEMTGFQYDASRKQNTNIKHFAESATGGIKSQYMPVPYDFNFSLYIYVRNIEDATQIVEHILSYFTPDYTIKLNLIPEMGIVKEIPIVINSTSHEIDYEGDYSLETRSVIWTINFTIKGFIFGGVSDTGLIKHSITSVLDLNTPDSAYKFSLDTTSGLGTYKIGEWIYQGYAINTATATGKVLESTANTLTINQLSGNFVSTLPIKGLTSLANYKYTSFNEFDGKFVQIDVKVDPFTANVSDPWIANTTITEFYS
jgi:hypothetical protein